MTDKYPSPIDPNALHIECPDYLHAALVSWHIGSTWAATFRAQYTGRKPSRWLKIQGSLADMSYMAEIDELDAPLGIVIRHLWAGGSLCFCVQDDSTP